MSDIKTIPPKSGTAFILRKHRYLKVICPDGKQVSDMTAHNNDDLTEVLNNGKTLDYEQTLRLTKGNTLYSNASNPMLEIIEDTCGTHDFLLAPCCSSTMERFYDITGDHPNCFNNLYTALKRYDVDKHLIPTAFNIFMNVEITPNLRLKVSTPLARPGDYIIFRACMDLIIGLTACSAGMSNGNSFKSIDFVVY